MSSYTRLNGGSTGKKKPFSHSTESASQRVHANDPNQELLPQVKSRNFNYNRPVTLFQRMKSKATFLDSQWKPNVALIFHTPSSTVNYYTYQGGNRNDYVIRYSFLNIGETLFQLLTICKPWFNGSLISNYLQRIIQIENNKIITVQAIKCVQWSKQRKLSMVDHKLLSNKTKK